MAAFQHLPFIVLFSGLIATRRYGSEPPATTPIGPHTDSSDAAAMHRADAGEGNQPDPISRGEGAGAGPADSHADADPGAQDDSDAPFSYCLEGITDCHALAECVDLPNSYACECTTGYAGDGVNHCDNIDECDTGTATCSHGCQDSDGGYLCLCPDGYTLSDDLSTCIDIDECNLGVVVCPSNSDCMNEPGDFRCECREGFIPFDKGCLPQS